MLKSIREAQKLVTIEGIENGQVNTRLSSSLLSMTRDRQMEVLSAGLADLKRDLAETGSAPASGSGSAQPVDRVQLQILIQVVEGLLKQV